ncbi:hypothetical protein WMO40_07815 [Bacillaceae bacterium CLA-AA-H227]|uniref:Uncharacterized protein n=1 Tax=Robertmurraya yapensis (ex Hitch et al 2024) TaxID=3133160 RepID=A0ACC6S9C9_9BACI
MGVFSFFPILMMFLYLAVFGFSIWFAVSLIKAQRERNVILKEISTRLEQKSEKDEL